MGSCKEPEVRPIVEYLPVEDIFVNEIVEVEIIPGGLARLIFTSDEKQIGMEGATTERRVRAKLVIPIAAVLPGIWLASFRLGQFWPSGPPREIPMPT